MSQLAPLPPAQSPRLALSRRAGQLWKRVTAPQLAAAAFLWVLGVNVAYLVHLVELLTAGTLICTGLALVIAGQLWRVLATRLEAGRRASSTLHSIGDAVVTTAPDGTVESMNPVAEALSGWSAGEARGRPFAEVVRIVDEVTLLPIEDPVARCLRSGASIALPEGSLLLARDGRGVPIEDSMAPVRDEDGSVAGIVVVFRDVTESREAHTDLARAARQDALTGLCNRREFEARVSAVLKQASDARTEHTVLYLDLDGFKAVNDTCGHAAGDELLRQLALLLGEQVRSHDLLARLGGDEFGVLLEACTVSQARGVAAKLLRTVQDFRFVWQDKSFAIGLSIGAAAVDASSESLPAVLAQADAACYAAKSGGGNRVHVSSRGSITQQRAGERITPEALRAALADDRFLLFWQRVAPLGEGGCQFEVLLRLDDGEQGVIEPQAFISVAERHHLMPAIDRWVVHAALRELAGNGAACAEGVECYAINLSGASVASEDFLDFVRRELAETGVPPQSLLFEIKETAAVSNLASTVRFMRELHALGCRFALDDFGSGLSSFGYLKALPVDFVKIDGSFVRDMLDDPLNCAMIEAINSLGHVLGIRTIAELVENSGILARLQELGTDYAQGYGIHRPVPMAFRTTAP